MGTVEDAFFCDVGGADKPESTITRRVILSSAQGMFDPISFSFPVTMCPKLLLQERWKSKLGWDKEVTEELSKEFTRWAKELPKLATLKPFGGFP